MELFVSVLAALFSVVNPFGAVPVFLALTPTHTPRERQKTARNTSIYFTLILLTFFFAGTYILNFFGINLNAMRIAGGMVILSSGFALLSGKMAESRTVNQQVKEEALEKEDISFAPMAMPMLSGPGSISLLIGMYAENVAWENRLLIASVVITTGILIYGILRYSPYLFKVLGLGGIKALSRIMGFLVMAIGVQNIISGIVDLVKMVA